MSSHTNEFMLDMHSDASNIELRKAKDMLMGKHFNTAIMQL